jgi:hypothetical protein
LLPIADRRVGVHLCLFLNRLELYFAK